MARVRQRVALVAGHQREGAFLRFILISRKGVRVQVLGETQPVIAQCSHQWGVMLEIRDNMIEVVGDIAMIILRVPNRLIALHVEKPLRLMLCWR